ncbi:MULTISPECIES: hypothetical protein [Halomonadaceae]|uniref:Uncharacterized protein n=1 Tax=Modicisalibacter zincidurans TaxID=1178777 RepID=A0ABP9RIZ5_9GAMM|nr:MULTISPECIES: hypothetical protein [Halomonas]MCD6007080.1 hypothetical protein [Halomonas sp. IOP_31]MEA3251036.1 hypothetical protein [Pseudomonadota bacterium]
MWAPPRPPHSEQPSAIFSPYIAGLETPGEAESLSDIAARLDTIFADIAEAATRQTS